MRVFAIAVAICVASAGVADAKPRPRPVRKIKKKKPPPPPPPSPEKVRADKLFEDGRKYLESKEYALACTAFEQSQEADPAIGTELNIALCYEEWGKVVSAYRAYLEAERLAHAASDDRQIPARKKAEELAPKVPHLIVKIPVDANPATKFLLDGVEIDKVKLSDDLLLEAGKHVIVATTPDLPVKETTVVLGPGELKRITVEVPRPAPKFVTRGGQRKKGKFYGGVGMTVAGAAALGVAGYVSLVARQDYADAVDQCPDHACTNQAAFDATRDARKRANLMTFVGSGGAVLVGVGVWFMLTSRTPKITERVSVTPMVGPSSIGFAVGGRL